MPQGARVDRIAEEIRIELGRLLTRGVKDPGIGFVTLTHVKVTADLQLARVYYTVLGDAAARRKSGRALDRATPFLRRELGHRLGLRRVPALEFRFDEAVEREHRIEELLEQIRAGETAQPDAATDEPERRR
jgi:ribosome-binding factor A